MTTTIQSISKTLVDEYIQKIRNGVHLRYAFVIPVAPVRKMNDVILDSRVYTARGTLSPSDLGGKLELKVKISLIVKIVFAFIYLFFFMFLIYDKVTINGIENPPFITRLTFVLVSYFAFSIPLFLLHLGKKGFVSKLTKDLDSIRKLTPSLSKDNH